jgi:hypothetical protein
MFTDAEKSPDVGMHSPRHAIGADINGRDRTYCLAQPVLDLRGSECLCRVVNRIQQHCRFHLSVGNRPIRPDRYVNIIAGLCRGTSRRSWLEIYSTRSVSNATNQGNRKNRGRSVQQKGVFSSFMG